MSTTYIDSKNVIKRLFNNSNFVSLAEKLVILNIGTVEYITTFNQISALLASLGLSPLKYRVNIIDNGGGFWYANNQTIEKVAATENHNTRPEIMTTLNNAWGNPIKNVDFYPQYLRCMVVKGYGLASRNSSTLERNQEYVAKTHKNSYSPLDSNVFTLRVSQVV